MSVARRWLWLALILIGAGYFGPWVAHKDAGLIQSADDLAEFVKFMPVVRSGELAIIRELFFIPIWITAIGLAWQAGRLKSARLRWAVLTLSGLLVFTPMPKYPELLTTYRSPEFAATFWITIMAALVAVGGLIWGRRLPDRVEASLWIVLGIAAASIAPLHFVKLQPEIAKLYHASVNVGWGVYAVGGGGVGGGGIGVWMWIATIKQRPRST